MTDPLLQLLGVAVPAREAPPLLGVEPNSDDWYIEQAVEQYKDEDIDIDDCPTVSASEFGAWVSAWVWVAKADEEEEDQP